MKTEKSRPVIIGLCGRSGAGKGLVSSIFAEMGIPSVDTDAVYRALTASVPDKESLSPCMKELVGAFSEQILAEDLSLDRRAMADIVFADGASDKLALLNKITHKHILAETDRLCDEYRKNGARAVIVDAPVLFESGYDKKCDITVALSAPDELLIKRITERDGITEEMARRRLLSQKSEDELRGLADVLIVNDSSVDALREKIREVAKEALKKG